MMIRIRSRDGLERVSVDNPFITIAHLKCLIDSQLNVPVANQFLSLNQNLLLAKKPYEIAQFADLANPNTVISSAGISHGSIVYLFYEGTREIAGPRSVITPRIRKMTIDDLIAREMQVTIQENPHCSLVLFDKDAANQHYVNNDLASDVERLCHMRS